MSYFSGKLLFCFRRLQGRAVPVVCFAGIVSALSAPPCRATPLITSVSEISTQQFQNIVITGSGFGTQAPYAGDSGYIFAGDMTRGWAAGYVGPCWNGTSYYGGFCDDAVSLVVDSWSDSSIVLGGFSGLWGFANWTLATGDEELIDVWNPQSGSGPASIVCFVGTACVGTVSQTPEPGSLVLVGTAIGLWGTLRFRQQRRRQITLF